MLSNVINVGKSIANKIENTILNLSEIESKIKDATNDEPWGPQGSLMKEIADETFSSLNFNEIMTFLWYRIFAEKPMNKRRTYKGLVLLSYVLINGSDYVAVRCRDHLYDIERLESFSDSNGIPDYTVRKKANDISDLIKDSERLQVERQKAGSNRVKFYGQNSLTTSVSMDQNRPQSIEKSFGDFDSWQPSTKSIPTVIGESFINFVNTFTQNISGPPPTETHDNFDIPAYNDEEPELNTKENTQRISDDKNSTCSKNDRILTNVTIKSKPTEPQIPIVDNEVSIIDFSEPTPTAVVGFDMEFSTTVPSVRAHEDDFGDFSGWTNTGINNQVNMVATNQTTDFFPDFDTLSHRGAKAGQSDAKNVLVVEQEKVKSDTKLGSTWNDIGSLKIDLNNVCGGRRPMYSKS